MNEFNRMDQQDNSHKLFPVKIERMKAYKTSKYMKILAIFSIIGGAFLCLSLWTIAAGILMILAGIQLKSAADKMKMLSYGDVPEYISETIGSDIAGYIKRMGIGFILYIIGEILAYVITYFTK